ncbi:DUF2207 domain-containing protein [Leucobacter zeae]|nr:DUF2207 domain-containing protein [Leucobacter zeae]
MIVFTLLFVLAPALVLLVLAVAQRMRSRQPVGTVVAEYAPLPHATLLYDAVMTGSDARALPAALVDLAVRRKVRLLVASESPGSEQRDPGNRSGHLAASAPTGPSPSPWKRRGSAIGASLSVEIAAGATFTEQERRVLAVFLGEEAGDRAVRRLSTDRGATGRRAAALLQDTIEELAGSGLIAARAVRWPHLVIRILGVVGIVLAALFAIVCGLLWTQEPEAPVCCGIAVGGLALTIAALVVCPGPWRRFLPESLPIRRHLAGMREYIRLAEAERMRVLESPRGAIREPVAPGIERIRVTERLLPYAILFGEERQWAEVLRAEAAGIEPGAVDALAATADVALLAIQLAEVAAVIVDAARTAGELVDAGGSLIGGIGDLLSIDL